MKSSLRNKPSIDSGQKRQCYLAFVVFEARSVGFQISICCDRENRATRQDAFTTTKYRGIEKTQYFVAELSISPPIAAKE